MYATASLHFHPHVERYCMSRQRSVYSLTFVHIYTYKWLCSLWPFIFLFFSFLFLLSLAGIANCIVLELEFRNVQLQYLWNGNYKILMTENQPSCPVCFFSLHVEDVKKLRQSSYWDLSDFFIIIYINTVKKCTCLSYKNTSKTFLYRIKTTGKHNKTLIRPYIRPLHIYYFYYYSTPLLIINSTSKLL